MKLKCPQAAGTISIGGASYEVVNHIVDVPSELAGVLIESHGMRDASIPDPAEAGVRVVEKIVEVQKPDDTDPNSEPPSDIGKMKRAELFAALRAKGVAVALPQTNGQLRNILRAAFDLPVDPADEPPTPAAA